MIDCLAVARIERGADCHGNERPIDGTVGSVVVGVRRTCFDAYGGHIGGGGSYGLPADLASGEPRGRTRRCFIGCRCTVGLNFIRGVVAARQ